MHTPLRRWGALVIALTGLLFGSLQPARADEPVSIVTLNAGTPVSLRVQTPVSSDINPSGEPVVFVTTRAVSVGDVALIPQGSPARGNILYARGAGMAHGSHLMVTIDSVQAGDGTWLPLRTTPTRQSGDRILSSSLMHKQHKHFASGKDMVLSPDTIFEAYLDDARRFSIAPSMAAGLPAQMHAMSPAPPSVGNNQMLMRLADGTPIAVHPLKDLSSGRLKKGQPIDFVVAAPLVVNGVTIVAPGAPARGSVLFDRHAGMFSQFGAMAFCIDSVKTVDGQWLDVHATTDRNGGNFTGMVPPVGPLWLSVVPYVLPGTNATLHANRVMHVFVNGDKYFALQSDSVGNVQVISVPNVPVEEATSTTP